jgi:hypothetical protein
MFADLFLISKALDYLIAMTWIAAILLSATDSALADDSAEWEVFIPSTEHYMGLNKAHAVMLENGALILDFANEGQIALFDRQGREVRRIGRRGQGPGAYFRIDGLYLGRDGIYAWDRLGLVVDRYDLELAFQERIRLPPKFRLTVGAPPPAPAVKLADGWLVGFRDPDALVWCSERFDRFETLFGDMDAEDVTGQPMIDPGSLGKKHNPINPNVQFERSPDGRRFYVLWPGQMDRLFVFDALKREVIRVLEFDLPVVRLTEEGRRRVLDSPYAPPGFYDETAVEAGQLLPMIRGFAIDPRGYLSVWSGTSWNFPDVPKQIYDLEGRPSDQTPDGRGASLILAIRDEYAYIPRADDAIAEGELRVYRVPLDQVDAFFASWSDAPVPVNPARR